MIVNSYVFIFRLHGVGTAVDRSPDCVGMMLSYLWGGPDRELAAVTVMPRAQKPAPGMAIGHIELPSVRFRICNRRLYLLVWVPWPTHHAPPLYVRV